MPLLVLLFFFRGFGILSKKVVLVSVLFCGNFSGNKINLVFFVKQFSPKLFWYKQLTEIFKAQIHSEWQSSGSL